MDVDGDGPPRGARGSGILNQSAAADDRQRVSPNPFGSKAMTICVVSVAFCGF